MIRFACPGCSATYTVGDEKAGKTGKCPKCQTAFLIPDAPAPESVASPPPPPPPPVVVAPPPPPPVVQAPPPPPPVDDGTVEIQPCPKCKSKLTVMKEHVGIEIECPTCQTVFKASRADAPPPPSVPKSKSTTSSKLEKLGSSTKDEDDDEDDRPSKRKGRSSSRRARDDDDDDDDRPSRRRSRSRRDDYDDDDEDYEPPARSRRSRRANGTAPPLVIVTSVFHFLGAASYLVCGFFAIFGGAFFASMFMGAAGGAGDPRSQQAVQGVGAGITTVFLCIGIFVSLYSLLYLFAGIGMLKMKTYGMVLTWIIAVLNILGVLGGGYGFVAGGGDNFAGLGVTGVNLAYAFLCIFAVTKHADEFG